MSVSRPNLFRHATSELSQDAALAWLLEWADGECERLDPALHCVAARFVEALFASAELEAPARPWNIAVRLQENSIDVIALVGDTHAIVIEDKVYTKEHSNQLERYKAGFEKEHPDRTVAYVYLKTGEQSSFANPKKNGWATMRRDRLLELLAEGRKQIDSDIYQDFLEHLEGIEAEVRSYRTKTPADWRTSAWNGFYSELQRTIKDGQWRYASNPSGGFMGFWWAERPVDECSLYLQLTERQLEIRLRVGTESPAASDRRARQQLRAAWSERIIAGIEPLRFVRPARFGSGRTMSVAVLEGDYIATDERGLVDMEGTLEVLVQAQEVFLRAVELAHESA